MTQFHSVNAKLLTSPINKLKPATKNAINVTLIIIKHNWYQSN